jgi:predicted ATPase
MIGKLQKLPESNQQVLRLAACVGNQFDLPTLGIINQTAALDTFKSLMPAIQLGLIQATSAFSHAEDAEITAPLLIKNYKFIHGCNRLDMP